MRRFLVLIVGLVLVSVAIGWRPVVTPKLVKFPTALNQTTHYQGTFVLSVDQSTGLPLAKPLSLPLTIDRHVQSVSSGAHVAVLRETITAHPGPQTVTQTNVYALNRRTMANVASSGAFTISPTLAVNRTGTFYLTLPMGLASSGAHYRLWKPETATSYQVSSTALPATTIGGAHVVGFVGQLPPTPVDPPEQAALAAQGFPADLTSAQFGAVLRSAGINVASATSALAKVLTATEMATVGATLSRPVPLEYLSYGQGNLAVEPKSGVIVSASGVVDAMAVRPVLTGLAPALAVLEAHSSDPAVAALLGPLGRLAAAPAQTVYEMRYDQTPSSVAAQAAYARSQAHKIELATVTMPLGVGAVGVVIAAAGLILVLRRRTTPSPVHQLPLVDEYPVRRVA